MLTLRSTRVTCEEVKGVQVVRIKGRLTRGSGGCETVRELIPRLVKDGARCIVVDLQKARKIDDSGLGELISATQHAVWRGCVVAFANLPAHFRKLLQKRMVSPFPAVGGGPYDSVDEAVKCTPFVERPGAPSGWGTGGCAGIQIDAGARLESPQQSHGSSAQEARDVSPEAGNRSLSEAEVASLRDRCAGLCRNSDHYRRTFRMGPGRKLGPTSSRTGRDK